MYQLSQGLTLNSSPPFERTMEQAAGAGACEEAPKEIGNRSEPRPRTCSLAAECTKTPKQKQLLYIRSFSCSKDDSHWLIHNHVALHKFRCILIGIHFHQMYLDRDTLACVADELHPNAGYNRIH